MICDMRSSESVSSPFVALTKIASGLACGTVARTTERKPCDGTLTITNPAPLTAFRSELVGVTLSGSATSER